MKLWQAGVLVLVVFLVAFIALLLGVIKIFPKYAPGEAIAIVKADYPTYSADALVEEYLGSGVWQVTNRSKLPVHFRIYEQTDTVEIFKEIVVSVPMSTEHPTTLLFLVLAANVAIFVAHVIFALVYWSKKRRIGVART